MLQVVDVDLTPNPHALKFIINEKLIKTGTRQFHKKEDAVKDPLAKGIFELEGVVSVFYMDKFITIEKRPDIDWGKIQKPFVNFIGNFDVSLIPGDSPAETNDEASDEMLKKINEILNMKVRPALANDGGGLEVLGLEGNTLKVRYQGACGSCPSAIRGTLMAIEGLLKRDINPAIEVIPA
jgi:NFU1 iron-sulfur cluster scaffold homolog, mitochondrial